MKNNLLLAAICMAFIQGLMGQQQTYWTPVTGIENNMTMSVVLCFDGVEQTIEYVEIGAFCGLECRAAALPYSIQGRQVYFLTIKGSNNDVITFRLYDHQSQTELDYECEQTYTFHNNDIIGEYPDWYPINFIQNLFVQESQFVKEWNWWAPVVPTNVTDLEDEMGENLVSIQSQNGIPDGDLVIGQMYKIQIRSDEPRVFIHSGIRPSAVTVSITPGYNWFGYTSTASTLISAIFERFAPVSGDMIISQDGGFAIFDDNEWKGTLNALVPGYGYAYYSKATETKIVRFQ